MFYLVLGNIIALIASLLMVYSGFLKQKDKIIYIQTVQLGLLMLSNIVLGGITGAITMALSCIRNLLYYKDRLGLKAKIIITFFSVLLSLSFNNLGIIGLFPLIATVSFLWLMNLQDIINFKLLMIFAMLLWFIYDLSIKSYVSALFDFMNIFANIITIFQIKIKRNKKLRTC